MRERLIRGYGSLVLVQELATDASTGTAGRGANASVDIPLSDINDKGKDPVHLLKT
jgi:hypothetical protein